MSVLRILDTQDKVLGTVSLKDGVWGATGAGIDAVQLNVFKPDAPGVLLTPNDGVEWLRGLQAEFRSGFVRAVLDD